MKLYALPFVAVFVVIGCSSDNDGAASIDHTALVDGTQELDQCVCGESDQVAGESNGCLEVVNHESALFCYEELTRKLSAYQPDESLWWSFELPGSNDQNKIEHLLVTSEFLVLVTNVLPEDIERSVFEMSSFEFGGAFVSTSREYTLPLAQVLGPIQAVAAHSYTYLIGDCFDADGQGTYVSRHFIPRNDLFNGWAGQYTDSDFTNSVCLSGMVREGLPSFEQPDKIVLSVNGEEVKLDLYTLNPTIAFNRQGYSLKRRVEIRDQLLAVLTEPETAYPDIARRVFDRIRIIDPDDSQPYNLDCVDGGKRRWNNSRNAVHNTEGGYFDYSNCRTGSLFVESGLSMWRQTTSNTLATGPGVSSTLFESRYAVSDNVSNEEWLVSTNSATNDPSQSIEAGFEFNIEFVNYTSPRSNLAVAPSRYTNHDRQQSWIGSFSRENYSSGITETVNVDITLNTDDAGHIQMSGSLYAMQVGVTTQTYKIEMLPDSNELIKYTVSTNDESMSVTESW